MGTVCRHLLLFAAACLAAVAVSATAGAAPLCGTRVLDDWRDGRIDGTYPVACYRQALAQMPEDLRVYSTAQADITRALQAQLGTPAAPSAKTVKSGGDGISPLLVVAITAAILVAVGSVAAAFR